MGQQAPKTPAPSVVITPSAKLLKPFYWAAAILAGLILAYANNTDNLKLYWLLVIPAGITLWTLARHLKLRYKKLIVSGGKLRFEDGMMSRNTRTMELIKVQDVLVSQSFFERMLNLGTISIETAGEAGQLTLKGIDDPQHIAEYILEQARR